MVTSASFAPSPGCRGGGGGGGDGDRGDRGEGQNRHHQGQDIQTKRPIQHVADPVLDC